MRALRLVLTVGLLALPACPRCAGALEPREVLVVANSTSDDSMELAKEYVRLRRIPSENLLLVKTTNGYNISREFYERQIRLPIRECLSARKPTSPRIRCICLIYGIPVRVEPTRLPKQTQQVFTIYHNASTRAEYRLTIDARFLASVGRKFPQPRIEGLTPLAKLFDPPGPIPERPPEDFKKALGETLALLAQKQSQVRQITDGKSHEIAARQLMALYLDLGGVQGLMNYIRTDKPPGAPDLKDLQSTFEQMQKQWAALQGKSFTPETARAEVELAQSMLGLGQLHAISVNKATILAPGSTDASVDSELSLLWWENRYNPSGWVPNSLNWRSEARSSTSLLPQALMTARIDGPSRADALKIIQGSIEAQKDGLHGKFYIDAGGLQPAYDEHLVQLYKSTKASTRVPVVLDTKPAVFAPNTCPQAALYVGWYSLRRYVSSCHWVTGAVGWHIASFEAAHLRDPESQEWCVKMIQNGVAATIGAVNEPYLGAFPLPEEFFPLLFTGKYTLAECYWRTTPMASWRLTLIADPLYNPFARKPQLDVDALPKGLAPPTR